MAEGSPHAPRDGVGSIRCARRRRAARARLRAAGLPADAWALRRV